MNEIKHRVYFKIYRLTNINNNYKFDRAKNNAGKGANSRQILAHYDRLGGNIQDKNGIKIMNPSFWKSEERCLKRKEKIKHVFNFISEFTSHPVISTLVIVVIFAIFYYYFKIDLSKFK